MRSERPAFGGKPHGDGRRMPSGRGKPAEHGLLCSLIVEMKRLRVILLGETTDVVLRPRHRLALEAHSDLQVVEPLDHAALSFLRLPLACVARAWVKTKFASANGRRQTAPLLPERCQRGAAPGAPQSETPE